MSWLGQVLFYEQWTRPCPADDSFCLPLPGCHRSAFDCNWQLTEAGRTGGILVVALIALLLYLLFIHLRWKRFLDRYGRFFPQAQREQDTLVLYWCCSKARLHMLETGSVTPNEISRVAQEVARLSRLPIGDGGAPFLLWLMNDLEQTERFVTHLKPAALRKITSQKQILFALQQLDTEAPHPQPGLGEHA